jgi:hypothetical protein
MNKRPSSSAVADRALILRDLHNVNAADLQNPSVVAAISELPEQRYGLYVARVKEANDAVARQRRARRSVSKPRRD